MIPSIYLINNPAYKNMNLVLAVGPLLYTFELNLKPGAFRKRYDKYVNKVKLEEENFSQIWFNSTPIV